MDVDGMWAAYVGDLLNQQASLIVLDTGRLFGGDSFLAYLGKYEAARGIVTADFDIWAYNRTIGVQTELGKVGPKREPCKLEATHRPTEGQMGALSGRAWKVAHRSADVPIYLVKIALLPHLAPKTRLRLVKGDD